jgi:predicted transposase YbfD/YdcC
MVNAWKMTSHTKRTITLKSAAETNNHGRIERRQCWLIEVPEHLQRATQSWTKLNTLAMVKRTRQVGDKVSEDTHYYISSLPLSAGAKKVANAIRSHWSVENNLHWSLDVAFNEDACRVRKDEGPANLACLRRIAQTQLKRETSEKVGIANKRARAGWDQTYLLKVLMLGVL